MLEILNSNKDFFVSIVTVILLMSANTLFKVASTSLEGTFDKATLVCGIKKYALILIGVLCMLGGGLLIPDMSVIAVDGQSLTILDALNAGAIALIVMYAAKAFTNLKDLLSLTTQDIIDNVVVEEGPEEDEDAVQNMEELG